MERKRVSIEVAQQLGISRKALVVYLYRHPDLRPAERLPNGDFLWSDEEIQSVVDSRSRRGKADNEPTDQ